MTEKHPLVGRKIVDVEPMTDDDLEKEGWGDYTQHADRWAFAYIVLDNGTKVGALRDPEGNGPGTLHFNESDGLSSYVGTPKRQG